MAITVERESRERMLASIRRYFAEQLEQDIGDLKATLVLDFFLQELAPTVYNGAIRDAQAWFQERVGDLDGSCYEAEFAYWS